MAVRPGVERALSGGADHLRSKALGLVQHQASVTSDLAPSAHALLAAGFDVVALFGPQHGARGEKQDNMVESADYVDTTTGLPVYSLYGDVRKPTPAMLDGLDALVFDLQDVGTRVYTFIWTMALAMEACAEAGVLFVVLDRPNPIGGVLREGPVVRPGFESFVGLHPLPLRHGLTCGEIAFWLRQERGVDCELEVVECEGLLRSMLWPDTGLPWVMPSPNLPTTDSCRVYPGMVLLEGTSLSEGRGTTRPFEIFGAPGVDPDALAAAVAPRLGPGVHVRACTFEPTFHKHAGSPCGGGQLHVTDAGAFRPVHTAVTLLGAFRELAVESLSWRAPPYEYEERKMPVDILWGGADLRAGVDAGLPPAEIMAAAESDLEAFEESAASCLLYG